MTHALLDWWGLPPRTIVWECACGDGRMAEAIRSRGYGVVSTDLYDRGYGEVADFMGADRIGDVIITNPPFSSSVAFIERAISLNRPFAFLLKSQYWHSSRRKELFNRHRPIAVLPLTWRPDFLFGAKRGASTMEVYWTVWGKEPSEKTIYQPLDKPGDEGVK